MITNCENDKDLTMISVAVPGAHVREGAVLEDGNKLKVRLEAHQTIKRLKGLIAKATEGLKRAFELQKHGSNTAISPFANGKTLGDCGLVSGSVLCVPQLDILFILPPGLFCMQLLGKYQS